MNFHDVDTGTATPNEIRAVLFHTTKRAKDVGLKYHKTGQVDMLPVKWKMTKTGSCTSSGPAKIWLCDNEKYAKSRLLGENLCYIDFSGTTLKISTHADLLEMMRDTLTTTLTAYHQMCSGAFPEADDAVLQVLHQLPATPSYEDAGGKMVVPVEKKDEWTPAQRDQIKCLLVDLYGFEGREYKLDACVKLAIIAALSMRFQVSIGNDARLELEKWAREEKALLKNRTEVNLRESIMKKMLEKERDVSTVESFDISSDGSGAMAVKTEFFEDAEVINVKEEPGSASSGEYVPRIQR